MKNFLKGALLASSLLGAYAVATEVMHPTTQVAEASLLDSLKSEAKKKNCAYSNLDWIYQPEGKCTFVKTSDGIMDVYGHHPKAKGKVIDTGAVFEAEDGKKGYISKYDLPKKCQEDFYEYGDNATFYIKCSNNKIYEYRNFGWTNVGLWYLDEYNHEWSYGADYGKFTRSSLSNANTSSGSSVNSSLNNTSSGTYYPSKYVYITYNVKFKENKSYLMKEWKKEGNEKYGRIYYRGKYKGTVIFRNIHEVTSKKQSESKYVIKNKEANIYKDKYFDKKVSNGSKYLNKFFISKLKYNVGNNNYYSVYDNNQWIGYIHSNNLRKINSIKSISKDIVMTNDQKTYKDLGLTTKKSNVKKGQVFKAKKIYDIGSKKPYYSIYGIDSKGKEYWKGYTYGNVKEVNKQNISKDVVVKKNDYTLWKNLYFNQKKGNTSKYINKKLTCQVVYTLNDNRKYYSLYSGNTWLGYVNASAVTTIQNSKKINQLMTMTGSKYTLWKNLAFTDKKGYATKGQVYQAKFEYTIDDNRKYYSVYVQDSKSQWIWCGYVDSRGIKQLPYEILNNQAVINNDDVNCWKNLYFNDKLGNANDYKEKILDIKNVYILGNGKRYCETYENNYFIGYIDYDKFKFIENIKHINNRYVKVKNNYSIYKDILLKNKQFENLSKDNIYQVKNIYKFKNDNNNIYQLYNNDDLVGYIHSTDVNDFSIQEECIENKYIKLKDKEIYSNIITGERIPIDITKDYVVKSKVSKVSMDNNEETIYYKLYDLNNNFVGYINYNAAKYFESNHLLDLKEKYKIALQELDEYSDYYNLSNEDTIHLRDIENGIKSENNEVVFINDSLLFLQKLKNKEIPKDWQYEETQDSIILKKYIGSSSKLVIPGELKGKKVYIESFRVGSNGHYFNEIQFKIRNHKKVIAPNSFKIYFSLNNYVTNIDVSGLDVSKITDMSAMFRNCKGVQSITGLDTWDVSNVTNMSSMFEGCYKLQNVFGLKNWDVSNVTNMSNMFYDCQQLYNLSGLENWNVSNVTNMSSMFERCYKLQNIFGLKNWDVSNVTNMSNMFYCCSDLYNLSSLKNWDVSNVIKMSYMFYYCEKLYNLSGLENWNVSNVTNMSSMFDRCTNLKDINSLFNWQLSNQVNMNGMLDHTNVSLKDKNQFFNKNKV